MKKTKNSKEMPDYDRVKVVRIADKAVAYCIFNTYDDGTKRMWKNHKWLLEHSITGGIYVVPFDEVIVTPIPYSDNSEYDRYVHEEFSAADKRSLKIKGVKPGLLLSVGVGDGYAFYEVVKVNAAKQLADIEWRGYGPDRWVDQRWGYSKTITFDEADMTRRRSLAFLHE